MCGFIARLGEHRTGITEVMGSNPVEALIFFRLLSNCLSWKFTVLIILHFHTVAVSYKQGCGGNIAGGQHYWIFQEQRGIPLKLFHFFRILSSGKARFIWFPTEKAIVLQPRSQGFSPNFKGKSPGNEVDCFIHLCQRLPALEGEREMTLETRLPARAIL